MQRTHTIYLLQGNAHVPIISGAGRAKGGKSRKTSAPLTPYQYSVMRTRSHWSENTYVPYLMEADADHVSRDSKGQRLVYGDMYIVCRNDSFELKRVEGDAEMTVEIVPIAQNEAGVDIEDRVAVLREFIMRMELE